MKPLKRPYFYYSDKRKIVPVASEKLNLQAREILKSIKRKKIFKTIPKEYQDQWSNVSLFHTKGEIEKAESIILDPERGSYSLRNKLINFINIKILTIKIFLISVLIIVAVISIPIISLPGNDFFGFNLRFLKHSLEWNYFLGVILFYLLSFFLWKKNYRS